MTRHWSEQREALKAWLLTNPRVLIGCDFDGTLAPLVDFADDACLPAATRAVLQRLISLKSVTVAFISCRPVDDLLLRVNLAETFYADNHGLEIAGLNGKAIVAPGHAAFAVPSSETAFIWDATTDRDAFRELPDGWPFYVGDGAGTDSRANLRDVEDCANCWNGW